MSSSKPKKATNASSFNDLLGAVAASKAARAKRSLPTGDPSTSSSNPSDPSTSSDRWSHIPKKPKTLRGMEKLYKGSNKGVKSRAERDFDGSQRKVEEVGLTKAEARREDMARAALERKALKYQSGNLTEAELANSSVDFAAKAYENLSSSGYYASHPSDADESLSVPLPSTSTSALPTSFGGRATTSTSDETPQYGDPVQEDEEWVKYQDEFGREREERRSVLESYGFVEPTEEEGSGTGYWYKPRKHDPQRDGGYTFTESGKAVQEVEDENVTTAQDYFPQYIPDPTTIARKLAENQSTPLEKHFDPTLEKRQRGAAAFTFSTDEEERVKQMEALKGLRNETELQREKAEGEGEGESKGEKERRERWKVVEKRKKEVAEKKARKAELKAEGKSSLAEVEAVEEGQK